MIQHGTIINVEVETLGAELSVATLTTDTVLHLRSTVDFTDLGGTVQVSETGFGITYSPNAVDDDALTLTLDAPIGIAYPADTFVYVYPAPIERYWAHVQVDGDDDDVILAELERSLAMSLARGARDPADMESSAILEERDGTWTVIDVLGVPLALVGPAIYVPDIDNPAFTVDENGFLTARTATFSPKDNTSVGLTVIDDQASTADLQQWRVFGVTDPIARITNDGEVDTDIYFRVMADMSDANGAVMLTTTGLYIGPGGATFPVDGFRRSANHEFTIDQSDGFGFSLGTADLKLKDGAGLWPGSDVRMRRSGLITLNVDDGASGPAVLRVTNLFDIDTRGTALTDPPAGRLRLYVTNDGGGHPQLRVRNNLGTLQTLTTLPDGA